MVIVIRLILFYGGYTFKYSCSSIIIAFVHYENTPMQYTENFLVVKMKNFTGNFFIFFLFLLKT